MKSTAHVKGNLIFFLDFFIISAAIKFLFNSDQKSWRTYSDQKNRKASSMFFLSIRLADLVKSTAHVKGNLNEGCVSKIKKPLIVSMNHSFQSL